DEFVYHNRKETAKEKVCFDTMIGKKACVYLIPFVIFLFFLCSSQIAFAGVSKISESKEKIIDGKKIGVPPPLCPGPQCPVSVP
ncbi:hypothetical protein, partial [Staphylococcus aureus]|uniref:hypothetical protein n=1 Tax=Staphylococcus aureus TaxID=1280 RepID=UPI0038B3773D